MMDPYSYYDNRGKIRHDGPLLLLQRLRQNLSQQTSTSAMAVEARSTMTYPYSHYGGQGKICHGEPLLPLWQSRQDPRWRIPTLAMIVKANL